MKKSILIVSLVFFTFSSCIKENDKVNYTMTVVKDCTGTYLRYNSLDYQVCNLSMVSSYNDGDVVDATFNQISTCSDTSQNVIICMMYHENEGWIEITSIK